MINKKKMTMDEHWQRRIESKLDQIAEVMVSLAKLDEKMINMFKNVDSIDATQKTIDRRVTDIENTLIRRSIFFCILDRAAWIAAAAAITGFFTNWFRGGGGGV